MKTATIIHTETLTQYFKEGLEVTPSPQDKLMHAIYGTLEEIVTSFRTELAVVEYKNKKELTAKCQEVAEEFKNFIHPNDLTIEL